MKRISTILTLILITITMWAQSPNKLSYQAVVRNASNELVADQAVGMQISILHGSTSGTSVYTETHTPTTNANGLVSIEIGDGATTDNFASIDWSSGLYFIKTEIDPAGGTSYTITGTSQLLSVPYAKYADKAGSALWSEKEGDLIYNGGGNVGIGIDSADYPLVIYSGANKSYIVNRNDATGPASKDGFLTGIDTDNNSWIWNYEDGNMKFGTNNSTRMTIKNDGNIGIGTTNPSAKLHVNGDAKFGSSGTVFSEIREFTGTTDASSSTTTLTLPSGYDEDNTRVLSIQIKYNGDRWTGMGFDATTHRSISYIINGTTMYIYSPDISQLKEKAFRILLMKIE